MFREVIRIIALIITTSCMPTTGPQSTPPEAVNEQSTDTSDKINMKITPADTTPFNPTHTVQDETPYYATSPQQGRPPEGNLAKDTKVMVSDESTGSYVWMEAENGRKGWVAASALKADP
ncbi:MAG: hypothetical protein VYA34_16420 [Myxococcota bacterium]|nr:hypothetical protein [Myxococcota bacterium]